MYGVKLYFDVKNEKNNNRTNGNQFNIKYTDKLQENEGNIIEC